MRKLRHAGTYRVGVANIQMSLYTHAVSSLELAK